ncbi:MAG TPA: carboxypeptidase regulatory-like domain-containing protein [Pyrinomonadaceae bacterium]|nr:carboxypeptidase regulatory-like domain-containing protein [Pyrinomonadaceae bacterium]
MTGLSRLLLRTTFIAVVFCLPSLVSGQPNTKPKATGSIGGRVNVSGKAAPEIEVVAIMVGLPNRRQVTRATTDSEGRYRLSGLSAGTYQVIPLAPTMVAAVNNFDYRIYEGAGKSVMLNESESVDDIDLSLVRGAVITGRITDAEGKPVVEEGIRLDFVDQNGQQTASGSGYASNYLMYRTDDRGIYRLYGLPPGFYKVSVGRDATDGSGSAQGGYYVRTFYPDTSDIAKAKVIELTEGSEATNIDIKLGQRGETFSVTGRVIDAVTGKPVVGIRPTYSFQTGPGGTFTVGGAPTDARGEFRFPGLAPGRYQIYASSRNELYVPSGNGGGYYSDPITIDVVDSDVTGVELKATQGLTISGAIMPDAQTNSNAISKFPRYRIMANVRSNAQPQAYTNGMSPIAADGTFQISGLSPGKVGFYIAPLQPAMVGGTLPISRIELNGVEVTRTLEMQPGQSLSDVRIFVSYGTGVIRGTVKFINGTMPSDARLYVGARRAGAGPEAGGTFINSGGEVDARGNFRIANLPPGTYEVIVNLGIMGSSPRQPPSQPRPPVRQTVTVTDETETEVQFTIDLNPEVRP